MRLEADEIEATKKLLAKMNADEFGDDMEGINEEVGDDLDDGDEKSIEGYDD